MLLCKSNMYLHTSFVLVFYLRQCYYSLFNLWIYADKCVMLLHFVCVVDDIKQPFNSFKFCDIYIQCFASAEWAQPGD